MAKGSGGTRTKGPISGDLFAARSGVVGIEIAERSPRLIAKLFARFPDGGKVLKYNAGDYNKKDIKDLENIAKIKAETENAIVEILPRINRKDANYKKLFGELEGTIYDGRCPDLKITTMVGGKTFVEYESFERPFSPGNLSDMLTRGSRQSSTIIIDIRGTGIKPNHIARQVRNKLFDKNFKRPIKEVWTYDGRELRQEYGK